MKVIKFSKSQTTIDENCTITIILSTETPIAFKISLADLIGMVVKTCEILMEKNEIPIDLIEIIKKNIKEVQK